MSGSDHDRLGGMTGATGDLTPDDPDDEFVPAETREISDAGTARDLTAAAHRRGEARRATGGDDPGSLRARGAGTAPNDRDGGYGSEHGLAADDPAYREEEHLPEREAGRGRYPRLDDPQLGGDQRRAPEDEHL